MLRSEEERIGRPKKKICSYVYLDTRSRPMAHLGKQVYPAEPRTVLLASTLLTRFCLQHYSKVEIFLLELYFTGLCQLCHNLSKKHWI